MCVCMQHAVNAGNDTDPKHCFGMCVCAVSTADLHVLSSDDSVLA